MDEFHEYVKLKLWFWTTATNEEVELKLEE